MAKTKNSYDWLSDRNGGRMGFQFFAILARELGNDPLQWKTKDLKATYRIAHDEIFGDKNVPFVPNGMAWRYACLNALLKRDQKLPEHYSRDYMLTVLEEASEANLVSTDRVKIALEYVNSAFPIKRKARRGIGSY